MIDNALILLYNHINFIKGNIMSYQTKTKKCVRCNQFKAFSEFNKSSLRKDRLDCYCRVCSKIYGRQRRQTEKYKIYDKAYRKKYRSTKKGKEVIHKAMQKYRQSKKGKKYYPQYRQRYKSLWPEKIQARTAVYNAVKTGKLPKVSTCKCSYCSEKAKFYHHYKGYKPEHWLDVIPMCRICDKICHN